MQQSDGNISLNELRLNTPLFAAGISTQTAQEAYATVLNSAGASLVRDAVDLRAVEGTATGITNYGGQYGANKGIIDNEGQVGGFPTYNTYNQITDIDNDGMDDEWEQTHGMIVGTKDDASDDDNDGYTNIEEYLNCLVGEGDGCDVVVNRDCNGDIDGTATLDDCGVCVGGATGQVSTCLGSVQGEDFCDALGVLEDKNGGFIGSGYINFDNQTGANGKWYVHAETAGSKTLGVRYANGGSAARSMSVAVDGIQQATFQANPTASWTEWESETLSLNLDTGVNEIVFTATTADGGPNVDLLSFESDAPYNWRCRLPEH